MKAVLVQFAKAPVQGRVKTRLIPAIGAQSACALHCQLVQSTAQILGQRSSLDKQLWASEPSSFLTSVAAANGMSLFLQEGADLGERMAFMLKATLMRYEAVILVGSDCPFIDANYLHQAYDSLLHNNVDVVIGPATDGGYVLLGVKAYHHRMFESIPWGSENVFSSTVGRIQALGWQYHTLPTLSDIDRPEDLALLNSVSLPSVERHVPDE